MKIKTHRFIIPLFAFICILFTVSTPLFSQILTVDHIILSGNKRTLPQTIFRELDFQKGDTIYVENISHRLESNRLQLLSTGMFIFVRMNISDWDYENNKITIHIAFKENWYLYPAPIFELADRNFNVWWVEQKRDFKRINYGMRVYHINLTGRRDRLKTVFQFGYTKKYELQYRLPALDKKPNWGIFGEALYAENKELAYLSINNELQFKRLDDQLLLKRIRLGGGLSYRKGIFQYHDWSLKFYHHKTAAFVQDSLNAYFFNNNKRQEKYFRFQYAFTFDKRDFRPYPNEGYMVRFKIDKQGIGFFSDRNNTFTSIAFTKYLPLARRLTLENKIKGRLALQRNQQPFYGYRALGYEEDFIRGYEYYVINGLDYAYLKTSLRIKLVQHRINWKRAMFIPQFRIMPFQVNLTLNNDIGQANDPQFGANNPLSNRMLWGIGIGLDLVLYNDKIIQLQYTRNHLDEYGLFLHYELNF